VFHLLTHDPLVDAVCTVAGRDEVMPSLAIPGESEERVTHTCENVMINRVDGRGDLVEVCDSVHRFFLLPF